jgi:hypothetical protein
MSEGKIIFVGLHNKPGMRPLDVKTKSGKLIDRIVAPLTHRCIPVRLTNLFDVDYMPKDEEMDKLILEWVERIELTKNDTVVLLGQTVHDNFPKLPLVKIIKIAHPASKRSHEEMDEYVEKTLKLLLPTTKPTTP